MSDAYLDERELEAMGASTLDLYPLTIETGHELVGPAVPDPRNVVRGRMLLAAVRRGTPA